MTTGPGPAGPVGPVDPTAAGGTGAGGDAVGPVDPAEAGGEAACWLDRLCPECGAMPEGEGAEDPRVPCWRCGAVRD